MRKHKKLYQRGIQVGVITVLLRGESGAGGGVIGDSVDLGARGEGQRGHIGGSVARVGEADQRPAGAVVDVGRGIALSPWVRTRGGGGLVGVTMILDL